LDEANNELKVAVSVQQGVKLEEPPPVSTRDTPCKAFRASAAVLGGVSPQWTDVRDGAPQIAAGRVLSSNISVDDWGFNHVSHDWNFEVDLDLPYKRLLSDSPTQKGRLEVEWEIKYLPPSAWPDIGDRVWMQGRWVFDCGHDDKTEIHPPHALVIIRHDPEFLPDGTDRIGTRAIIFLSGKGGGAGNTSVEDIHFQFEIPLPTRASPNAEAKFLFKPDGRESDWGNLYQILPPDNPNRIKVTVQRSAGVSPLDPRSANIWAYWDEPPAPDSVRTFRVTIEKVKVLDKHDQTVCWVFGLTGCTNEEGEWVLYAGVNGRWDKILDKGVKDNSEHTIGLTREVSLSARYRDVLPEEGFLRIAANGYEKDCDLPGSAWACAAESFSNDEIGKFFKQYRLDDSRLPPVGQARTFTECANPCDYQLTYTIERIR